jgi:hypothetical protein
MQHIHGLPSLLVAIAATVAAGSGCSQSWSSCPTGGPPPPQKDISVTPDVACAIAAENGVTPRTPRSSYLSGKACDDACGPGFGACDLPDDYVQTYVAATSSADAGVGDAGSTATCPSVTGTVKVHCGTFPCEGRRTDGIDEPRAVNEAGLGAYFASASYLEAVSVHAFARLRFELAAHGAPDELLALVTRAEADEVRHASMTRDLAHRFGAEPEIPTPVSSEARDLFTIALENAVEGCVRETYGAAVACFRAMRAEEASVRAAMESIARDECEHADLAHRIGAWALPRLSHEEREAIHTAMRAAMNELLDRVDDHLASEERGLCGAPSPEERRQLAALVAREVVAAA